MKHLQAEQRLTLKDKSNLNTAIQQTVKLSKFSLKKRVRVLKNEWWYWHELNQSESMDEITHEETIIEKDNSTLIKAHKTNTEEILELFSTIPDELVHTNYF